MTEREYVYCIGVGSETLTFRGTALQVFDGTLAVEKNGETIAVFAEGYWRYWYLRDEEGRISDE